MPLRSLASHWLASTYDVTIRVCSVIIFVRHTRVCVCVYPQDNILLFRLTLAQCGPTTSGSTWVIHLDPGIAYYVLDAGRLGTVQTLI